MIFVLAALRVSLLLSILIMPFVASAQPFVPIALPLPKLVQLPDRVREDLDRDTWSSVDGQDWGIKIQDDDYVEVFLSLQACERWLSEGKRLRLRVLRINGDAMDAAACRHGVNKAQHPPIWPDAKDFEAIIFKVRPTK